MLFSVLMEKSQNSLKWELVVIIEAKTLTYPFLVSKMNGLKALMPFTLVRLVVEQATQLLIHD